MSDQIGNRRVRLAVAALVMGGLVAVACAEPAPALSNVRILVADWVGQRVAGATVAMRMLEQPHARFEADTTDTGLVDFLDVPQGRYMVQVGLGRSGTPFQHEVEVGPDAVTQIIMQFPGP